MDAVVNYFCEKSLLYLLDKPDFKVVHLNPGAYVKNELGIDDISTWMDVNTELIKKAGLVEMQKSPNTRDGRPDTMALNIGQLVVSEGLPYVTDEVTRVANEKITIERTD